MNALFCELFIGSFRSMSSPNRFEPTLVAASEEQVNVADYYWQLEISAACAV